MQGIEEPYGMYRESILIVNELDFAHDREKKGGRITILT